MMGSDHYQTLDDVNNPNVTTLGIGARCFIKNAILDKNCSIGDDVRINGSSNLEDTETETYAIKDGIVVIKKNAVIPPGFVI